MTIDRILPNLYISDIEGAYNFAELQKNKINAVVNVAYEIPCNTHQNRIPCYHFTWDDNVNYNIYQYFNTITELIHKLIGSGKNVLVHCHAGISRSASAIIAYLIRYYNKSYYEAYTWVRSRRIIIRPNPSFKRQLITYWHEFKAKKN